MRHFQIERGEECVKVERAMGNDTDFDMEIGCVLSAKPENTKRERKDDDE